MPEFKPLPISSEVIIWILGAMMAGPSDVPGPNAPWRLAMVGQCGRPGCDVGHSSLHTLSDN